MKLFIIIMVALNLNLEVQADDHPGVHQRLFSVLNAISDFHLDTPATRCIKNECVLEIKSAKCLRNSSCEVTFVDGAGKTQFVELRRSNRFNLSLYIIMRSAYAVQLGDFHKYGPRFRPHFRLYSPLTCTHDLALNTYHCL